MSAESLGKEKVGAVGVAIMSLEKTIRRVDEEYEKLHNRVTPILSPVPEVCGKPEECPQNPVALAQRIEEATRQTERIFRKIQTDNEQLEL
jgi:hypothetical protein